jgi:hypothetical protein
MPVDNVYTLRYNSMVAGGIEFDWDAANMKHLAAHNVTAPTKARNFTTETQRAQRYGTGWLASCAL